MTIRRNLLNLVSIVILVLILLVISFLILVDRCPLKVRIRCFLETNYRSIAPESPSTQPNCLCFRPLAFNSAVGEQPFHEPLGARTCESQKCSNAGAVGRVRRQGSGALDNRKWHEKFTHKQTWNVGGRKTEHTPHE